MTLLLAVTTGALFAAGWYLMMRPSAVKLVLGVALVSHAANLAVFTAAGPGRLPPPLLTAENLPTGVSDLPVADPVPQALVLTAIVIGFGVLAFTLVLVHRAYQTVGSDDLEEMESAER